MSVGVWSRAFDDVATADARDAIAELDELGYSTLWVPEVAGRDPFTHLALLLADTTSLAGATGIASIWARDPIAMRACANTLAVAYPERFTLGLGVSHDVVTELRGRHYTRPLAAMDDYLDQLDTALHTALTPAVAPDRVLAALGPRMLDLAARRADGALTYLATVDHTRLARHRLGARPRLCVEQAVVVDDDPARARTIARTHLATYLGLANYRANWQRLGFDDTQLADGGSDAFVDAVVAWGGPDEIATRIGDHIAAGADHVAIQPLGDLDDQRRQWRTLAPYLTQLVGRAGRGNTVGVR